MKPLTTWEVRRPRHWPGSGSAGHSASGIGGATAENHAQHGVGGAAATWNHARRDGVGITFPIPSRGAPPSASSSRNDSRAERCVEAVRDDGTPSFRYYLSSARLTPERFARAVRSHWAIENSLHWVLDVTIDEDAARNRADNGPENLAILRRLTLNLRRTARPELAISRKRKRVGWSDAFARSNIGQMPAPDRGFSPHPRHGPREKQRRHL